MSDDGFSQRIFNIFNLDWILIPFRQKDTHKISMPSMFRFLSFLVSSCFFLMTASSSLRNLATFRLGKDLSLMIARGSVVDFSSPLKGAIVNAANEGCLGGGGVDGAITTAGGPNLAKDRLALPVLDHDGRRGIRCPTGSAVLTGPGYYGSLQVPYVIHAVGPNYMAFSNFETPDQLLRSAYHSSLECCRQEGITISEVAFALLSAGIFRGDRDSRSVLHLGVCGIRDWMDENSDDCGALESVTLCGFSSKETDILLDICGNEL
jgi:O-acetyl-ADP-ribose deacetylase (regulator of RNase III)